MMELTVMEKDLIEDAKRNLINSHKYLGELIDIKPTEDAELIVVFYECMNEITKVLQKLNSIDGGI